MRHPNLAIAALSVTCLLLASACGGKDDSRAPGEPGSREEAKQGKGALEKVVGSIDRAHDADCMNRLRALGRELATDPKTVLRGKKLNGFEVPFILFEASSTVQDPAFLFCPKVHPGNVAPPDEDARMHLESATDYEGPAGVPVGPALFKEPRTTPILWDKKGNHEGYRFVLFLDGQVREVANKDFQAQVLDVLERAKQ